jgi:hypothetical protein
MKDISLSDNPLGHLMESLESKLDRLSPEQRKEVEDFVDFLVNRSGSSHESSGTPPVTREFRKIAPPPLIAQEPVHPPDNIPLKSDDTIPAENSSGPVQTEQATPFHEVSSAGDDRITRDYMDYGQFEQNTSPAIIAVKKVKEKLQKSGEQQKPRVSLDWID